MTLELDTVTLSDLLSTSRNLDCATPDELMAFWSRTNSVRPISFARQLFPERPKGYVGVTRDLGCYASNKATAIELRLDGKIQDALMYEGICDRIYDRLPEYARW
jgi:hypothetical protein